MTYTLMHENSYILDVQVVDKRETALNSTNMEICGLLRGLHQIIVCGGLTVQKLVTDQHKQIQCFFRKCQGI